MKRGLLTFAPLTFGVLLGAPAFAQSAPTTAPAGEKTDAPAPSADNKEEARAHYNKALGLFDDGAFDAAFIEFKKAYELSPSFRILYNMGVTSERLKDFVGAVQYYDRFLKEGGADVKEEQRANVKEQVQLLRGRIAKVTLKSNVPGAIFSIDDIVVGPGPIEAREVNSGMRKFSVQAKGYVTTSKVVSAPGGDTLVVDLPMESTQKVIQLKGEAAHIPWIGIAGTVVFTGGAIATGILTLNAGSKYDGLVSSNASKGALDDQRATVRTWSITTDVLVLGAIGFATYTVIDILTHRPKTEQATVTPTAMLTRGGGMLGAVIPLQ